MPADLIEREAYFGQLRNLETSPITSVHLWFDREVTNLPHATLLDRTMQWMFNKDSGKYLQLVVSASRDLTNLSRNEIIDIAIGDLRLYFPRVRDAQLVKAHVIKEQRATFSAAPESATRTSSDSTGPKKHELSKNHLYFGVRFSARIHTGIRRAGNQCPR